MKKKDLLKRIEELQIENSQLKGELEDLNFSRKELCFTLACDFLKNQPTQSNVTIDEVFETANKIEMNFNRSVTTYPGYSITLSKTEE